MGAGPGAEEKRAKYAEFLKYAIEKHEEGFVSAFRAKSHLNLATGGAAGAAAAVRFFLFLFFCSCFVFCFFFGFFVFCFF